MKAVFADAFYFVALLNRADQYHAKATSLARQLRDDLVPKVKIIPATHDLFELGLQLYSQRLDKDWPLTDCVSFVVMSEAKLRDALTGDRHFEQAGFRALLI